MPRRDFDGTRVIKFADELVLPVISGEKTATVRYDGFESVSDEA
jgi:uncharacterized protein YhfF